MNWSNISADEMRSAIEDKLNAYFSITSQEATRDQVFQASAMVIRELMSRLKSFHEQNVSGKQVHYLSMEFLIGRSLLKNAYNLGVGEALSQALEDLGFHAADVFDAEPDAGLGNGGLGRLAACYMDSMATEGINATGYSICYELGIFRQVIRDGRQTEVADNWRLASEGWLVSHYDEAVEVRFGGYIRPNWDESGHYTAEHVGYQSVIAVPRDMLIAGYDSLQVNTLRLWDAHSTQDLDMYLFATGKYVESMEQRTMAEVITKVLYPADDHLEGKTLRLKQQYFFVSATAQTILRQHRERWGDVRNFAEHHVIQINDTHPTMIVPELMRILMDEDGLGWDEAWDIVHRTVAYTNHTVMAEALEKWPQDLIQRVLPRIWEIICEINRRWRETLVDWYGEGEVTNRNLIIQNGYVHMANLCLASCYRVNGVSQLHGDILKTDIFRDVCRKQPEKFTYVTNGIDHRRWLSQANPALHGLICDLIGDGYLLHPEELSRLDAFREDEGVLHRLEEIKRDNKVRFARFAANHQPDFLLDPAAVLDVQAKRLHEYKRQLMCAMLIVHLRNQIHNAPNADFLPRSFVFAAKAAPGYAVAKRIIELLCSLSREINQDPLCKDKLQVFFLENYQVSAAERLMPAAQISEQISTAGKEASGTGNMKLMMNGAITIGTLDGANVEMHQQLGDENMFLFGLKADEAEELRSHYDPVALFERSPSIQAVFAQMNRGFSDGKSYSDLTNMLLYGGDPFLLLADFESYAACSARLYQTMGDVRKRAQISLTNIARSGIFAADRAIREYAEDIWKL